MILHSSLNNCICVSFIVNYLDTNIDGTTAVTDSTKFYGYHTNDFEKDGKVAVIPAHPA